MIWFFLAFGFGTEYGNGLGDTICYFWRSRVGFDMGIIEKKNHLCPTQASKQQPDVAPNWYIGYCHRHRYLD